MAATTRIQKRYDHRLRELVRNTQDISHAVQMGVPPSTARGLLRSATDQVISVDVLDMKAVQLQREVLRLRNRVRKLTALLRVFLAGPRDMPRKCCASQYVVGADEFNVGDLFTTSCLTRNVRRAMRAP